MFEGFVNILRTRSVEWGLLRVAVDPAFETNRWIYVYCTSKTPQIHNRVSRFTGKGDRAIPSSEKILVNIPCMLRVRGKPIIP